MVEPCRWLACMAASWTSSRSAPSSIELTLKSGQTHVQRYTRPLLDRIQKGDVDPSFIITHTMSLDDAPEGYEMFLNKEDECLKVVLKT